MTGHTGGGGCFEKTELEAKKYALLDKICQCGRLELELSTAQAPIGSGEEVMRDFTNRVCTGYILLVRAQVSSYRDRRNAVIGSTQ